MGVLARVMLYFVLRKKSSGIPQEKKVLTIGIYQRITNGSGAIVVSDAR